MKRAEFHINVDQDKKEMKIYVGGQFNEVDVEAFIANYQKEIAGVHPEDCHLVLDCKTLLVVQQEMIPMLKKCYELYKISRFKKVVFIVTSAVVGMQLRRIARDTGLTNAEVIQET